MFVQISPSEKDLSETLSSLNFATRVRGIELGPAKKQMATSELQKMKVIQSEKQVTQLLDRLKGREKLCSGLQIKIKELEHKLKKQEQQLQNRLTDLMRVTPNEGKTCIKEDELMSDIDLRTLRSFNRPMSQGSVLPKGKDYLHLTRKKRESRSRETENTNIAPASLYDNKKGKSDPPKVARMIRTAKPVTKVEGPSTNKRIIRDQTVLGIKERDSKKKIWSR
ncbi:hypothetical protein Q3G72_017252 [Acer saccharum]|nr:hypothetical protein Q3G72_017252 [Acer saccharum]